MAASLQQIILTLSGACLTIVLILLTHIAIKCRLAWWRFKLRSRGLPMFDDVRLLGNNILTLGLAPNASQLIMDTHKRLGKTFGWVQMTRYGAYTCDLDLIKRIVIDEGDIHLNRTKTDFPMHEIEQSILLAEDDQWRKLRRFFAPAFKSAKFKTPNVQEEVDKSIAKLIDHIEERLGQGRRNALREVPTRFEVDDLVHKFNLQVIFSCFYKQYDLINFEDEPSYWVKTIDDAIESIRSNLVPKIALFLPALNPLIDWLVWNFHPQGVWRRLIMDFVRQQTRLGLEARKELEAATAVPVGATGGGRTKQQAVVVDRDNFRLRDGRQFKRNMVDYVIDHYLDGKLTKEEFFNTSFLLLTAADKTTTDVMVHLMYLLATHPREQELARDSVKAAGYEGQYLAWTINEALRLFPPAPAACSRTIKHDIEIEGGHVLPAGSFVGTPAFTIHRLREYWGEDAEEFRPERWADTSHHHPLQYIPFGAGQRGCLGKEFALFEMKKVLAALLTRYEFRGQHKDDAYVFDTIYMTTLIPNSPTFVTIKRLPVEHSKDGTINE